LLALPRPRKLLTKRFEYEPLRSTIGALN